MKQQYQCLEQCSDSRQQKAWITKPAFPSAAAAKLAANAILEVFLGADFLFGLARTARWFCLLLAGRLHAAIPSAGGFVFGAAVVRKGCPLHFLTYKLHQNLHKCRQDSERNNIIHFLTNIPTMSSQKRKGDYDYDLFLFISTGLTLSPSELTPEQKEMIKSVTA